MKKSILILLALLLLTSPAWGEEIKVIWGCGDAGDFELEKQYQCIGDWTHSWENRIPLEEEKILSKIYIHIDKNDYRNRFWKCKNCGLLRVDWAGWTFYRTNKEYVWSGACDMFHSKNFFCVACSTIVIKDFNKEAQ